jgi:excisionase family DNA binding protein
MSVSLKPVIESGAVYSRQEAAQALGISLSTLKRLVKNGYLRVSKPEGMRRVFITGETMPFAAIRNAAPIAPTDRGWTLPGHPLGGCRQPDGLLADVRGTSTGQSSASGGKPAG